MRTTFIASKFITLASIALSVLAITGCATRPSGISASYVSHEKYAGRSCKDLGADMVNARERLEYFSDKQNLKANVDAATVLVALIPLSALSGDSKVDVAQWKGEVEAISTAQTRKGC